MFPFQIPKGTVHHNQHTFILSTTPMFALSGERVQWEANLTSMAVNQDTDSIKYPLKEPNINILTQNYKLD